MDTEIENGRHKEINLQISELDTKLVTEKHEEVFNKLHSATIINIALGFVLRIIEVISLFLSIRIRFEKSYSLCTKADLIKIQGKVEKFDIVEQCTQERQNTKWRFKLTFNVTIFAALLKNIQLGCPDFVLSEPLLRHTLVNCLFSKKDKKP